MRRGAVGNHWQIFEAAGAKPLKDLETVTPRELQVEEDGIGKRIFGSILVLADSGNVTNRFLAVANGEDSTAGSRFVEGTGDQELVIIGIIRNENLAVVAIH